MSAPVIQYGFGHAVIEPDIRFPLYAMPAVMAAGGMLTVHTLHLARLTTRIHGRFAKAMLVS
ncbi:MAG TPA: hypothetical protein PLM22_03885 [Candidatus Sabulitectum sp.]|nr:hypothetical protein [Candidatus Sabulitectum sp.]HPJ28050.1 hypothetical protein [Candidatus Sabulitectum sp.]HPR21236.1 hypothetical protein [Candidatus Sabulitectum sp.]